MLHKEGYKSAIVGKWHLGTHPNFHPLKEALIISMDFYQEATIISRQTIHLRTYPTSKDLINGTAPNFMKIIQS